MKILIMLTLIVLISAISFRGQGKVKKSEDVIRETDSKLTAAILQGDAAAVDSILADDYIEINAQGLVRHKSDVMTTLRARNSVPPSKSLGPDISLDETNFHVRGDTVILTSLKTTKYQFMENQTLPQPATAPAQTASLQERVLKVYSKLNGRWQLLASQATAVAQH